MALSLLCISFALMSSCPNLCDAKEKEYLKDVFLDLIAEIPFRGEFPVRQDILDIVATAAPALFLLEDKDIQQFVERRRLDRDSFRYRMLATLAMLFERREFRRRVIGKLDAIKSEEIKSLVTKIISEANSSRQCWSTQ